jgi:hypothetical protein
MRAKTFLQFIAESRNTLDLVSGEQVNWWFDRDTDFTQILGDAIWMLSIENAVAGQTVEIMRMIEKLTGTDCRPLMEVYGYSRATLYFSIQGQETALPDTTRVGFELEPLLKGQALMPSIYRANSIGISRIISTIPSISTENLVSLAQWAEEHVREEHWHQKLLKEFKRHPEWPEDITDWALGDW